ncbi:HAD family hydrolase [Shouchella shacheensis]|uniref:HAD family hydrolase n=1 Tax=Shouchella shacheensis TaxID=1649580 RepID=UPI00073FEEDB|nr:HAD family hydrolase [Shouchella shacheensis]
MKAVLFDLDDTLLWDERSIAEAFKVTCEYARKKNQRVVPAELEAAVRKEARALYETLPTYEFTQNIGINPFEGLWGQFQDEHESFAALREAAPGYQKAAWARGLEAIGVDDVDLASALAEQFPLARRRHPYVYDESFRILEKLRERYSLLLITNGSPDLQNTKLEITPQLVPYFDHIVISGAYGKGKPDKGIFEHALGLLNVANDEALMVGDNLWTDILGANRAGIRTAWINRTNKEPAEEITPTYEISALEELYPILEKLEK